MKYIKFIFTIIVAVTVVFPLTGCSSDTEIKTGDTVSLEEYNNLSNGIDYQKVCKILGLEGKVLTKTGEDGDEKRSTVLYTWKKEDGALLYLTFQDNKLVSKSQY